MMTVPSPMQPIHSFDTLMNVAEVAAALHISIRQVWKLATMSRLPAPVRISRSVRWRASDISEYIRLGCPDRAEFEAARQEAQDQA